MGTGQRRQSTTLISVLGTALAVLLVASSTQAQDALASTQVLAPEARAKAASQLHRAALAAFAKGRFHTAIARWTDANELRASAAIAFNIARSYEKLDDQANALTWYRSYLGAVERPDDQTRVARHVEELEQQLALRARQLVTIRSIPRGAAASIDGGEARATPWVERLAPGPHVVAIDLIGFYSLSQRFEVRQDQPVTLELVLTRNSTGSPRSFLARHVRTVLPPPDVRPLAPVADSESVTERGPRTALDDHAAHRAPGTLTLLGVIALAAGAAAIVGALALETMRKHAQDDARAQETQVGFAAAVDVMRSRQTFARVFAVGGAGLIVTGGVILLWPKSTQDRPPSTRVALLCPLSRCGASVTGTF